MTRLGRVRPALMVVAVFVLMTAMVMTSSVQAAAPAGYPSRPVTVYVGWGAGGGTDLFARMITRAAEEIDDIRFVILNLPGASGTIASSQVQGCPADGYTIWAMGSNYVVNLALGTTPYDLSAWEPVARVQHDTGTIQVAAASPFKSLVDLVSYAKENPGQVTIGGTGAGSFDDAAVNLFAHRAGIEIRYVPYNDASQMRGDLLGGHIDAMWEEIGPSASLLQDGSVRALCTFTDDRVEGIGNVLTAPEQGVDVTLGIWRGILVRKGTPAEIVEYLQDLFRRAMDQPSYREFETNSYLHLRPGYLSREEFGTFLEEETELFDEIFQLLGR